MKLRDPSLYPDPNQQVKVLFWEKTRPPTRLAEFLYNPADKPTIKPTEEVSKDNQPINQQTIPQVDPGVNMASFAEVINNITH